MSLWCSNIVLTRVQQNRLIQNSRTGRVLGSLKGAETNKRKKEDTIKLYESQGVRDISILSDRDILILGIALYWAEGSKKYKLSFINSDPAMILFMYNWFQKSMGVKKNDLIPRVFINEIHKPRIKKVLAYWSKHLGVPRHQFGNPVFNRVKQKKVYVNHDNYYGMLALRIKHSTHLLYRITGLIRAIQVLNYKV